MQNDECRSWTYLVVVRKHLAPQLLFMRKIRASLNQLWMKSLKRYNDNIICMVVIFDSAIFIMPVCADQCSIIYRRNSRHLIFEYRKSAEAANEYLWERRCRNEFI